MYTEGYVIEQSYMVWIGTEEYEGEDCHDLSAYNKLPIILIIYIVCKILKYNIYASVSYSAKTFNIIST